MTAPAATTIAGVSVLTRDRRHGETFDLGLSTSGLEIRRPGRDPRLMSWDRVSEWEIEERDDDVLLTLRGDGATTPLVITGVSAAELEAVMRSVTDPPAPSTEPQASTAFEDGPAAEVQGVEAAVGRAEVAQPNGSSVADPPVLDAPETEGSARVGSRRALRQSRRRIGWKSVVTVALLVILAAAVTLVLLQSAGVIDWGFLGPTA